MSSIISLGINRDKIQFNDKGWANVDVFINDDVNQYGQNASAAMSQTKEEREGDTLRNYIGNGRVVWTTGTIEAAPKMEKDGVSAAEQSTAGRETPDLPF